MFNNVGMLDRLIRFSLTGVLLYLGFGVYGGSALGNRRLWLNLKSSLMGKLNP